MEVVMEEHDNEAPGDKFLVVYFIILMHGIGTLMPWNMFIVSIRDYFQEYKLHPNYNQLPSNSSLGNDFAFLLPLISQIPNIGFNWINIYAPLQGDINLRIIFAIIVVSIILIITIIGVFINTSTFPLIFCIITFITVFIMNIANGIYQNSLYGLASKLPNVYMGAVVLGNNICGLIVACMNIMVKLMIPKDSHQVRGALYFGLGLSVLSFCLMGYFVLPHLEFYKYYDGMHKEMEREAKQAETEEEYLETSIKVPYKEIFRKCSIQCFNIFYTFLITLTIFPGIQMNVHKNDEKFFITDEFYTDIMCFMSFSVFAVLGNLASSFVLWPSPNLVIIPTLLRTIFIPLFLFCKYCPSENGNEKCENRMFDYIFGDYVFAILGALMSFTGGYYSSVIMRYVYWDVEPEHAPYAAMFGGACLVTGIFIGLSMAYIWPIITFI